MRLQSFFGLILWPIVFVQLERRFNILALIPYNGQSHWAIFRPILEELAGRGNNVTVLSHHPRKSHLENYFDISIADPEDRGINVKNMDDIASHSIIDCMKGLMKMGVEAVCQKGLQHPKVKKLLESDAHFDLIITEVFNTDCFLGFVHKFRSPFVGIRTSAAAPWSIERIANPDNPSYIPNTLIGLRARMDFWDRLKNLLGTLFHKAYYRYYDEICTNVARQHFGKDMPPLEDIANNISLMLVNTHFAHHAAKPLVPGLKEIAGVHIGPAKPLSEDLEEWISGAEHGVIFFSLGSMLRTQSVSMDKRRAIFEAFESLPQRVLMKWEANETHGFPSNVKTVMWLPQYDVISHPNVRVFITHGGMLGATEAVYAGKPMIVIPAYGDQLTNAALLEEKGIAIHLNYGDLTKETLSAALNKILHDSSYQRTAMRMSEVIRDRLVPPLNESVYWIEYVARHGGAPFLRTSAHGMPYYQYLLLDVIGSIIIALTLTIMTLIYVIRRGYNFWSMKVMKSKSD